MQFPSFADFCILKMCWLTPFCLWIPLALSCPDSHILLWAFPTASQGLSLPPVMASSDLPFRAISLKSRLDQVISFHWLSIIHGKKKILGINCKASPDLAFFMSFSGLFPTCCSLPNTACCSMGPSLSTVDIWGWIIVAGQGLSCATVRC